MRERVREGERKGEREEGERVEGKERVAAESSLFSITISLYRRAPKAQEFNSNHSERVGEPAAISPPLS